MSKRSTKRNGRGQIVSYEIEDTKSQTYGEVLLSTTNTQEFKKYEISSFRENVDSNIVEFAENEEYKSTKVKVNIPLPGLFGVNQSLDFQTTSAAIINANPKIDLGYIASIYIDPQNTNNGSGGSGNGGS